MFAGPPSAASSAALVRTNLQVDAALNDRSAPVLETGAVATSWRRAKSQKPQVSHRGGGRESNPPASSRPHTGFEDRGAHQPSFASAAEDRRRASLRAAPRRGRSPSRSAPPPRGPRAGDAGASPAVLR